MRRQFGLSTVLSLVALLIAMSGTAVATTALLVKKNSQVAKHVIAGADAPRGDNQNIIPGSVGSGDLHPGSVTSSKIGKGAVTGRALADGSVTSSKIKLPSFNSDVNATPSGDSLPTHSLVSASGLTLGYTCPYDSDTSGDVHLQVVGSSSVSGATFNGVSLTSAPVSVETLTATVGNPASVSGFQTYLQGSHVTLVYLEMSDRTAVTSASCHVDGLVLPSN
jgi:hypothetical protein